MKSYSSALAGVGLVCAVSPLPEDVDADREVRWLLADSGPGPERKPLEADTSVVFFERHTTAVLDSDDQVEVKLFRVGHLAEELTLEWWTCDGTATAGTEYIAATGVVTFPAGSDAVSVPVSLLPGMYFKSEKFFAVRAQVVDNDISGSFVGGLPFSRVRILFTSGWPLGAPNQVPKRKYLYFNFLCMVLRWRQKKFFYVVIGNLWLDFERVVLSTLLLNYALYDYCLSIADDPRAYSRVPLVVLTKFVFILLNRLADNIAETNLGNSSSVSRLQGQIVHKYLEMQQDAMPVSSFSHLFFQIVPECVAHGWGPIFKIIQSLTVLVMSLMMAVGLPALKGSKVMSKNLVPLLHFSVLIPIALWVVLNDRRRRYDAMTKLRCASQLRVCRVMQDLLDCRHWIRAFDDSYPAQHVRFVLDQASETCWVEQVAASGAFQNDSQWVAKYLGEVGRLLVVLHGSYAVLDHERTGADTMTLGELAVFLSLYSAVISAVYTITEALSSLVYASVLLKQIAAFLNTPNPRILQLQEQREAGDFASNSWRSLSLTLRLSGVRRPQSPDGEGAWYAKAFVPPCSLDLEVPFGCVYAVKTLRGCDSTRREIALVLGGRAPPSRVGAAVNAPPFARALCVATPATLGAGSVLEVLMAGAADWVRARDACAVAAVLGVPFDAPPGVDSLHGLEPARLFQCLVGAIARSSSGGRQTGAVQAERRLQRLPSFSNFDTDDFGEVGEEFRARLEAVGFDVLSPTAEVLPLLKASEIQLLDLARGLLADPDVLVVQDSLAGLAMNHGVAVLRVLKAWQRLGGLRGLVNAWEEASVKAEDGRHSAPRAVNMRDLSYPPWLTAFGGLSRTVVISESSIVSAGLSLDQHVDAWIEVDPDKVHICRAGLQVNHRKCVVDMSRSLSMSSGKPPKRNTS